MSEEVIGWSLSPTEQMEWLRKDIRKLKTENTKLRELANNLYECNGSCNRCVELMGKCEYEERLREFGIEVEDA